MSPPGGVRHALALITFHVCICTLKKAWPRLYYLHMSSGSVYKWEFRCKRPGFLLLLCTCVIFVPSLAARSAAIAFTALLASDNLPPPSLMHGNTDGETLSDVHALLFAYSFHLEIVVLVIRRAGRKCNYGAGFRLVTGRHWERARVRHGCMR